MSKRRDRMVSPTTLQTPDAEEPLRTPEGDQELLEREVAGDETEENAQPAAEDAAPRVRLAAARAVAPAAGDLHWRFSFTAGRDAAVSAVAAGEPIPAVRALHPPEGVGCRACWAKGRNAALRAIEG